MLVQSSGFTNPLLPYGPDPWAACRDGFYYYTHSTSQGLTIWKTRDLTRLAEAEYREVWRAPDSGPFSRHVWAPEIHCLTDQRGQHCWYAYLSADDGHTDNQRIWVLENPAADPLQGKWTMKGRLVTPGDKWSIDGTVIDLGNQLYFAWSGWEGDRNEQQNIYLCRMRNPWTCAGKRLLLSAPTLPWERHNRDADPHSPLNQVLVNEAPAFVRRDNQLFIAYSASGCWTDAYAMGLLSARCDSDLMRADSWTKAQVPIFTTSAHDGVYGPGHGCFFHTSAGHTWLLYHANPGPNKGCENQRTPRLQPVHWHPDGTPDLGVPLGEHRVLTFS